MIVHVEERVVVDGSVHRACVTGIARIPVSNNASHRKPAAMEHMPESNRRHIFRYYERLPPYITWSALLRPAVAFSSSVQSGFNLVIMHMRDLLKNRRVAAAKALTFAMRLWERASVSKKWPRAPKHNGRAMTPQTDM